MNRLPLLVLVALVLAAAAPAEAQRKKKPTPVEAAPPAEPAGPTPEQLQATAEFQEGQALQQAGDLDGAIARYEAAFALYPDPDLQFLIGEVHRLKGDRDEDFTQYEKAIPFFERYLELAPDGKAADAARQRISALEQGIANYKRKQEAEKAEAAAEAEAARKAEEEARAEREAGEGTQFALDVSLTAGTEPDLTGIARLAVGGLMGWGRFAFEGHIGFAGFLRAGSAGVAAREVTLLDLGARYAFTSPRFVGPFVGTGGSFGLITGKPRARKLEGDTMTCGTAESCTFDVDKNITGRLALGWGFESSAKTTVAVRLDLSYVIFSVDGEQPIGSVPAVRVEKPQDFLAVLVGLEFMHWP
jgi:hypothetical protein